jgi:hypothetical protein
MTNWQKLKAMSDNDIIHDSHIAHKPAKQIGKRRLFAIQQKNYILKWL